MGSIAPAVTGLLQELKNTWGLYPKVLDPSEDMSDSRASMNLLVKIPSVAFFFFFIVENLFAALFWNVVLRSHGQNVAIYMKQYLRCRFCKSINVRQLCLLLLIYRLSYLADIAY